MGNTVTEHIIEFSKIYKLSLTDFYVLSTVSKYSIRPSDTIIQAKGQSELWSPNLKKSTRSMCENSLTSLIARGIIASISDGSINKIELFLHHHPAFGPVQGLPKKGAIDFTLSGSYLWQTFELKIFGKERYSDFYSSRAHYLDDNTLEVMTSSIHEDTLTRVASITKPGEDFELVSTTGPSRVDAWRDRWWRRPFPGGYSAVSVYKHI